MKEGEKQKKEKKEQEFRKIFFRGITSITEYTPQTIGFVMVTDYSVPLLKLPITVKLIDNKVDDILTFNLLENSMQPGTYILQDDADKDNEQIIYNLEELSGQGYYIIRDYYAFKRILNRNLNKLVRLGIVEILQEEEENEEEENY